MKRRYLTPDEKNIIIEKLRAGISINSIREETGRCVDMIKRISEQCSIPVVNRQNHTGMITGRFASMFTLNSKATNSSVIRCIKHHNLIPHDTCWICGTRTWLNKHITLELDHINGTGNDNRLENLRFLCPNCHSQTDTYKGRNKGVIKVSDDILLDALRNVNGNIRQALIQVGLVPRGGNYTRAHKLLIKAGFHVD